MPQVGCVDPAKIDELLLEIQHESDLFPEDSDESVTFAAGGVANTFSSWIELAEDGNGTTFSSKVAEKGGHISGLLIEALDTDDKRYLLEIAYGDDKVNVLRHRFIAWDTKKLNAVNFIRIRAEDIPAGETVYYRMKCETALATCEISLRYHDHSS
ncbi:hypothetical protein ES703_114309 [subsurface metagenome]